MDYNRLKELRISHHISQKELAERLKISQQTVASWEVGRTDPSNLFLSSLSKLFNVSTDYLLGNENQNTQPLSKEQKNLLRDFESLTREGRNTLLTVLSGLKVTHSAAV